MVVVVCCTEGHIAAGPSVRTVTAMGFRLRWNWASVGSVADLEKEAATAMGGAPATLERPEIQACTPGASGGYLSRTGRLHQHKLQQTTTNCNELQRTTINYTKSQQSTTNYNNELQQTTTNHDTTTTNYDKLRQTTTHYNKLQPTITNVNN